MDEQQISRYLYLIQELLRCSPSGEEAVLSDNPDLLDAGLVEMMRQMAAAETNPDIANRLNALAVLVEEKLNPPSVDNREESANKDRLNFIFKVLKATRDSMGNPQVVYPILLGNLAQLDDKFAEQLRTWATVRLSEVGLQQAQRIAATIAQFGNLIQQFPHGSKAANMEISLAAYKTSLKVFTRHSHAKIWAMTHNSLGIAYNNRIRGNRAENLERAIAAYQKALQICTQESNPINWAATQDNLGGVYIERIRGNKADNLERAIEAFQKALQVRTQETNPIDWAGTHNNLGVAYTNRISGDRAENLEMAIAACESALQVHTKKDFPMQWAMTQNDLGTAYRERIRGDRADNLERAIAAFQKALEVYTLEGFPIDWAMTQNNLGVAYRDRIRGNKADNLERAIAAFQKALEVYTLEGFPIDWASTQHNLGAAYSERISGKKAENMDRSIAAYENALSVHTRKDFPIYWAETQNNLGNAYHNKISGDRAENLEKAIAAFQNALQVHTLEANPIDWAITQNNFGCAYGDRISGDRAENLERAIVAFQNALQVHTKEALPINWAMTQNNLGNAYNKRISGDRAENRELAIATHKNALEVHTKEAFPIDWAMTQNYLGNAYSDRIQGDTAENRELAIATYQNALEVYTKEAFPTDWAETQNNLGIVYSQRIKGDTAENRELAIAAYRNALEVYTKEAFPTDWAMTQNNLGIAYRNRIQGDTAENRELAITAYQKALEVYTPEANPIQCLGSSRNLGNLYFKEGNWQPAIDAYETAITAVELSRSWANTDNRRQQIMAETIEVYQRIVQAYINTEQWDKAIETVERSKARNLVELLTNRDLYPKGDVPQEIIVQLDELRGNIPSLERQLQVATDQLSKNSDEQKRPSLEESQKLLQQELQQSRQQLDEVLNQIKSFDSSFSLTQKVETIRFEEIQNIIGEQTATIQLYETGDRIITSIITSHSSQPLIMTSSKEKREVYVNWVNKYIAAYYRQNQEWKNDLSSHLAELAKILKIDETLAEIDSIFARQRIKCNRLLLVPHRFLHLLPLHALPLANGDLVCDKFPKGVSYAPSCQLLQLTQKRQRPDFNRLFAIQNPTEDLVFTNLEVETVRSFFSPATVLAAQAAREAEVKTHPELSLAHCNHFSCHGEFNLESPLKSALRLAETKQSNSENTEDGFLTLAEIFALNLTQSRLVTLSACETGMADFNSLSDEYISLPSGFLFAGSPSVVSSLWAVSDISTSFLMMKFYENLQQFPHQESGTVALALNQAQKWLRNLTSEDCETFLDSLEPQWDSIIAKLPKREGKRVKAAIKGARQQILQRRPCPFANPYYWAAFTATGF
ncbi:MAG: CHAT domain-containing protein [Cyanobacteria bacterium P01_H01_bin.35]